MYSSKGTLQPMNLRLAPAAFAVWVALLDSSSGLTVRKANHSDPDPKDAFKKFQEMNVAENYMDKWKPVSWETARRSCDTDKLPETTDRVIRKICGEVKDGDRCVCNTAKAHSCHVGCQKAHQECPSECRRHPTGVGPPGVSGCYAGDPKNGGKNLSQGLHGECHSFCSQAWGPVRYCGVGGMYQAGMFVDCTLCSPEHHKKNMTRAEKRAEWELCMVGCYPKPSCIEMCSEGTTECYTNCVGNYRHVVDPYWDLFQGSLQAVPISAKVDDPEPKAEKKEESSDKKAAVQKKAVTFKESESVEEDSGEEEDDYDYGDGDEGEWKDPFAGENEWEDDALKFHGGRQVAKQRQQKTDDDIVRLFGIHPKRSKKKGRGHRHRHRHRKEI